MIEGLIVDEMEYCNEESDRIKDGTFFQCGSVITDGAVVEVDDVR